ALNIDFVQQWTQESVWAIQIDGGGANAINSYLWDYSYYGSQGKYMIDVRGDDGRDNTIRSNISTSLVNFNTKSNTYIPNSSIEINAIGLRRVGNIINKSGVITLNSENYIPRGITKAYKDPGDNYNIIVEYTQGIDNWRPYIQTQSLTNSQGYKYSLIPVYNQSGVQSGKAYFIVINNVNQELVPVSSLPNDIEFNIEIICAN
ncbi:TPA: hypothetical protein ACXNC4_005300, partial [Escherichia coli]